MEAKKLKTSDDLEAAWLDGDRFELINGEIVKRPMPRYEHGVIQLEIGGELKRLRRVDGPGGWWFATEVSVRYNEHHTPTHDIAGWRKERLPQEPTGVVQTAPDWVCEIVSKGHERKDTVHNFLHLQRYQVPYYWLIWPEERVLIAYKLVGSKYAVIESIEGGAMARIEPFAAIELDLGYILGESR